MNDNIKSKLYHYEAEPPEGAWDAIVTALENNESLSLKEQLYSFEEAPPTGVWNKIDEQLNHEPIIIPFYQRYAAALRYVAAAVVILFMASGIFFFNNQKTLKKSNLTNAVVHQRKKIPSPPVAETRPQKLNNLSVASPKLAAPNTPAYPKFIKRLPSEVNDVTITKLTVKASKVPVPVIIPDRPMVNHENLSRYMIFSSKKGNAIKISKKLFSWMNCAYNTDAAPCRKKIKTYQAKMAAPTVALNTDFTGVIEMLDDLKEKP